MTLYPSAAEVIAVHARLIAMFGGSPGLPRSSRAWAALEFNDLDAYSFLIGLYDTGRFRRAELEEWLRKHASPKE